MKETPEEFGEGSGLHPSVLTNDISKSLRAGKRTPKPMDGNFYGTEFSDIDIDPETLEELKDSFLKFLPAD